MPDYRAPVDLLRLPGEGPYETPVVRAVQGPAIFQNELPIRLILILEGGTELRVPFEREELKLLRKRLDAYFADR